MSRESSEKFGRSLLAGLVSLPLILSSGCRTVEYHETSNQKGTAIFLDKSGTRSTNVSLSVCNDARYVSTNRNSPKYETIIEYAGKKGVFVQGELVKFVLNSDYFGIGRENFCAELLLNGAPIPERRYIASGEVKWVIVPYPNLEPGSYTVQCYATQEFVGKIDFEVVANPGVKK